MAKRFTDTDKWKKQFIKGLPLEYKMFWLYILDECNHAGIWHVEFDLVQLRLGITLSEKKALGLFNANCARVVVFDNGNKWFVPGFIEFQYGKLGEKNKAHKSVIDLLSRYDLLKHLNKNKPPVCPLDGAMDKDKDKDIYLVPELFKRWQKFFPDYPAEPHKDFEPLRLIGEFIANQKGLSIETDVDQISETFEKIAMAVKADDWWANKPLSSIEKKVQEFYTRANVKREKKMVL